MVFSDRERISEKHARNDCTEDSSTIKPRRTGDARKRLEVQGDTGAGENKATKIPEEIRLTVYMRRNGCRNRKAEAG